MSSLSSKPGFGSTPGKVILVTGSSGFVGARLVEMLLERGAAKVICFDIAAPSDGVKQRFAAAAGGEDKLVYFSGPTDGNLTSKDAVFAAFAAAPQIDLVYHIAALVGPYHTRPLYQKVNYDGTLHVLDACRHYKVPRLVFSSSPSTRFHGGDVAGLREDQMTFPSRYLALYAESKAAAERAVSAANDPPRFFTIAVAPHQVYGPHDSLFLPKLLETAGHGRLRIFGKGRNLISVCHVDNYCHGLLCGADTLQPDSPTLAKFYIITDGPEQYFWDILDQAVVAMGFPSLHSKFHLPVPLLMLVAYVASVVGFILNKKFKLNPFSLKMLIIHRYFNIDNARRDLNYEPLIEFQQGWPSTIEWFQQNWLPGFLEQRDGKKTTTAPPPPAAATSGKKEE